MSYDSAPDTRAHIQRVRDLIYECRSNLAFRGYAHDASKLKEPEKSIFDAATVRLKGLTYGTPEYAAALDELKEGLKHHYAANSHHPEHYASGIDGMSLFDVMEMLMDWKAATERMKDGGDIWRSLQINAERFRISPQLLAILENTAVEMKWDKKAQASAAWDQRG